MESIMLIADAVYSNKVSHIQRNKPSLNTVKIILCSAHKLGNF